MKAVKFLVLLSAVAAGAVVHARTEPNSFLNRPAGTVQALVGQARSDAKVMSRFQRHFGWSREEVLYYLGSLKPGALKQDGVYLVYNCNNNEEIMARVMFYKKGTRVWLNAEGEPVMKVSCANPMVRGTDNQPANPKLIAEMEDTLRPVDAVVPGDPEGVQAALIEVEPDLEAQVAGDVLVPAVTGIPPLAGAGFSPLWLAPLGALGFIRTGGGGDDDNPPPPPVPEPATLLLVGAGGAALAARRQAKKAAAK